MKTGPLFLWNKNPELFSNVDPNKKIIAVNQGGSSCFHPDTEVYTNSGLKKIKDIQIGDYVLSHNIPENRNEYKKVLQTYEFKNTKPTVKIKLKNGKEIICTDDHLFFVGGTWISAKKILSLYKQNKDSKNENNS